MDSSSTTSASVSSFENATTSSSTAAESSSTHKYSKSVQTIRRSVAHTTTSSSSSSSNPTDLRKVPSSPSFSYYSTIHNNNHNSINGNRFAGIIRLYWSQCRHPTKIISISFLIVWTCWTIAAIVHFPPLLDPSSSSDGLVLNNEMVVVGGGSSPLMMRGPLSTKLLSNTIPLPLPKEKVTAILMNHSRPRMIRESSMMRTLLSHPSIDEVLLLHSNPATAFEFIHPKVRNIDAIEQNNEMGLSLRFYFCQIATSPWILHLDDDMEFTTEALNEMLIEYSRNTKRIVGRFGRDLARRRNSFHGYNSKSTHKSTEVVLTKFMIMERDLCGSFFEYSHLVWSDVVHNGEGPLWNGEDIFMSLVANHVYEKQRGNVNTDPSGKIIEPNGRHASTDTVVATTTSSSSSSSSKLSSSSSSLSAKSKSLTTAESFKNNYAMDWIDVWAADDKFTDYDNVAISGGMQGIRFWDWRWWSSLLRRNRHYSYRGKLWQLARARLKELGTSSSGSSGSSIGSVSR